MGIPILQVDAFTDRPFAGNPAAVCLLDEPADASWMQAVAQEMNLSETAFLHPAGGDLGVGDLGVSEIGGRAVAGNVPDASHYHLRWFTPAAEVELCGHATLASAHALWESGRVPRDQAIVFHTLSGPLIARPAEEGIELDFPATPVTAAEAPPGLLAALGLGSAAVEFTGRNRFDYLVAVADAATVRGLAPDFGRLRALEMRGIMVTSTSDDERCDFVSRFFAPAVGVDEDPVTGSAHCTLGPYWREILGHDTMVAYQASARGGRLRVTVRGERVLLAGRAVTVMVGELAGGASVVGL